MHVIVHSRLIFLHRCGDQSSVRFFKADPPISRGGSCGRKAVGRGHFVPEVCGERAEKSTVGKALSVLKLTDTWVGVTSAHPGRGDEPQKGRRLREEETPTLPGATLRSARRAAPLHGEAHGRRGRKKPSRRASVAGVGRRSHAGSGESLRGDNARRASAGRLFGPSGADSPGGARL
jgi:hypothetical protein